MFEKFRNTSLKNPGLYFCHCLYAPALSRHVILNVTKVELKLISDEDICLFIEKGMRGRIFN